MKIDEINFVNNIEKKLKKYISNRKTLKKFLTISTILQIIIPLLITLILTLNIPNVTIISSILATICAIIAALEKGLKLRDKIKTLNNIIHKLSILKIQFQLEKLKNGNSFTNEELIKFLENFFEIETKYEEQENSLNESISTETNILKNNSENKNENIINLNEQQKREQQQNNKKIN